MIIYISSIRCTRNIFLFVALFIAVHVCLSSIAVTTSPNVTVIEGTNTKLRCSYTGVEEASFLVIRWVHISSVFPNPIWTYDGKKNSDVAFNEKFSRVKLEVTKTLQEHSIRLNNASLEDEGVYFCNVEYRNDEIYSEGKSRTTVTVIGTI